MYKTIFSQRRKEWREGNNFETEMNEQLKNNPDFERHRRPILNDMIEYHLPIFEQELGRTGALAIVVIFCNFWIQLITDW